MRALALALVCLTACRSVDRELVKRIEREMTKNKAAFKKMEPAPEPGAPVPVPWSKGQYAVWAITTKDSITLTEAQIEEADQNGVIVMMTTISPKLRSTARLTFRKQPHTHDEARDFLTQVIRRRGDERALTYRFHRDMPIDMRDALESLWATLVPQPVPPAQGSPPTVQTVTTVAATLEGCQPAQGTFYYSPLGLQLNGWMHPAVPITGLVMAKAKTGESIEVVDMGWAGPPPAL